MYTHILYYYCIVYTKGLEFCLCPGPPKPQDRPWARTSFPLLGTPWRSGSNPTLLLPLIPMFCSPTPSWWFLFDLVNSRSSCCSRPPSWLGSPRWPCVLCCRSGPSLCFSSLVRVQLSLADPIACSSPSNCAYLYTFSLYTLTCAYFILNCAETSFVMQLMGKYKKTHNADCFEPLS